MHLFLFLCELKLCCLFFSRIHKSCTDDASFFARGDPSSQSRVNETIDSEDKDEEKSMQLFKHLNDRDYDTASAKMPPDCWCWRGRFSLEGSERCGSNLGRCHYLCLGASDPRRPLTIALDFIAL